MTQLWVTKKQRENFPQNAKNGGVNLFDARNQFQQFASQSHK